MTDKETGAMSSMLPPEINGWVKTDPDCYQYQKRITETAYSMIQMVEMPDRFLVERSLIDLGCYTEDSLEPIVNGYYDSLAQLREIYGDASDGIIAECIFEQMQPIEHCYIWPCESEEKAISIILESLKTND